ncbi:hypothetical protein [Streptomyces sp. CS62]|uniref:hypothetical protein n=1 Tax=Streptomyces sp. CS62 TaxID=3119268 RepID=UPI002F92762C
MKPPYGLSRDRCSGAKTSSGREVQKACPPRAERSSVLQATRKSPPTWCTEWERASAGTRKVQEARSPSWSTATARPAPYTVSTGQVLVTWRVSPGGKPATAASRAGQPSSSGSPACQGSGQRARQVDAGQGLLDAVESRGGGAVEEIAQLVHGLVGGGEPAAAQRVEEALDAVVHLGGDARVLGEPGDGRAGAAQPGVHGAFQTRAEDGVGGERGEVPP